MPTDPGARETARPTLRTALRTMHRLPPHQRRGRPGFRLTAGLALILVLALGVTLGACDDSSSDDPGDDTTLDTSGSDASTDATDAVDTTPPETCSESEPCTDAADVCDPATSTCVPRCSPGSCPDDMVCDMESELCVEGSACSTNDDCTVEGEVCNACRGVCIPDEGKTACTEDIHCFSDEYCDPCSGLCELKVGLCDECVFDRECGEPEDRCVDLISAGGRFCLQACTGNDCPTGYRCEANEDGVMQCVPGSGRCDAPAECEGEMDEQCTGMNEICRNGLCVPGCTPGGCPSGQVCEKGRCKPPCDERAEPCPSPSMCEPTSGLCEIEGQCSASKDCPAEHYCDIAQQMCVPGCQTDDDCRSFSLECVEGSCETRGCEGSFSCAFEQVCDTSTGECMAAEGPHCEMCDPMDEMACGGEPNKCLTLQDDMGNDAGSFCFVACSSDPDNACPQGYQCTELQDSEGNPAGEVCFRDCNFDPFE